GRVRGGPLPLAGDGDVARASWAFPIAGLVVGLAGAIVYWFASRAYVPPLPASALAIATTILVTGAMHEDGLADTADGFGGGKSREQKLQIMRDSRIGTYGACALMLRWSALAEIADPRFVTIALIAAHVSARATLPAFMCLVPPARADGLSSDAGRPPPQSAVIAFGLATICLFACFGASGGMLGLLFLSRRSPLLVALCQADVGGRDGGGVRARG